MNKYLIRFLVLIFFTIPFLAPFRVDLGFLSASPEGFKSFFGVSGVLLTLLFWLLASYKKIDIYCTRVYLPIAAFILWSTISLLWVEDGYLAILTLTQFVSYGLIFFLIINVFQDKKNADLILYALIYSLALVSIIGLLQHYLENIDLIQNIFGQTVKPGATFGNKNMASHFVVMTLPLALVMLLSSKNNAKVVMYGIITALSSWFLIYTLARQAYVAIFVELLLLSLYLTLDKWKNKEKAFFATLRERKSKGIAVFFILLFLIFVSNFTNQGFKGSSSKIEKIQSISVNEDNPRIPAWRNTVEMIKDHLIIGVGVGQWAESYPLYYDRAMKDVIFNEKTRLKRLHNDYLEIFANSGLIGFAILMWLVYLVITRIWKILKDADSQFRPQTLGLALGLTGFSIVSMFSFPVEVYLPAFLAISYMAIIFLPTNSNRAPCVSIDKKITSYVFIFVFTIFTIFIINSSYKWILGEHFYGKAIAHEQLNQSVFAAGAGIEALKNNSWAPDYYAIAGNNASKSGKYQEGILLLKKAIDISPFNTPILLNLATTYRLSGNIDMEKKVLDFIIRFDSKNVIALARLVRILANSKNYDDLKIVYSNMKRSFDYFNGRSGFGPYHDTVGQVAVSIGDYEFAKYVYQDAIDKNLHMKNYVKLATVEYYHLNNQELGIKLYKKALSLDSEIPNNKEIKELIKKYESSAE